MKNFNKADYYYTSLFCEENIWHLAQSLINESITESAIHIIFLSNKNQQIALFNQLSAAKEHAVIWDYHVVLVVKMKGSHYLFDFDSRLPFVSHYESYLKHSLPNNINPVYRSQFRIIPAKIYLDNFYSDRSHMDNIIADSNFPDTPCILSDSTTKIDLKDLFDCEKNIANTLIFN